jgi:uncharacterized cupredoxin-like copper-binding protein
MKLSRGDRDVFGVGTIVFALLAMLFGFFSLIIATRAESASDTAKARVAKIEAAGIPLGTSVKVTLEEFTITPHPAVVKAGSVTFEVDNVGSITHEMVIVRASSPAALPKVTKAGERAVGDVNEEAITKADTIGETGDVPARTHTTKTFNLTPGNYVLFCNIDNKSPGSPVLNHFQHGMSATLTVG